jgi:hypothetical protein
VLDSFEDFQGGHPKGSRGADAVAADALFLQTITREHSSGELWTGFICVKADGSTHCAKVERQMCARESSLTRQLSARHSRRPIARRWGFRVQAAFQMEATEFEH